MIWLISYDRDYYPYVETFRKYEQAKKRFQELLLSKDDEEACIYLSEVKEYSQGIYYDIEFEDD